ncbi:MAG TPA: hypothetical protein VF540_10055, partial [Segetibacter sp.]
KRGTIILGSFYTIFRATLLLIGKSLFEWDRSTTVVSMLAKQWKGIKKKRNLFMGSLFVFNGIYLQVFREVNCSPVN